MFYVCNKSDYNKIHLQALYRASLNWMETRGPKGKRNNTAKVEPTTYIAKNKI